MHSPFKSFADNARCWWIYLKPTSQMSTKRFFWELSDHPVAYHQAYESCVRWDGVFMHRDHPRRWLRSICHHNRQVLTPRGWEHREAIKLRPLEEALGDAGSVWLGETLPPKAIAEFFEAKKIEP